MAYLTTCLLEYHCFYRYTTARYVRIGTDASGTPVSAVLQGVATDARFARSFKGYSIDYYHRRLPIHNPLPPPPPAYF